MTTPLGCTFGYNWYQAAGGPAYLTGGQALRECYDGTAITWGIAPTGATNALIPSWTQILHLDNAGNLIIPGTAQIAPAAATNQAATLGQVQAAVAAAVTSWNGRTGAVTLQLTDVTAVGGAPLASPGLTGVPTAPTASAGTNTLQLATTQFVTAAVAVQAANSVTSFNGRQGVVTQTLADITGVGGAPLASPTFTGIPAAPTASAGTATTQLATTQFVTTAVGAAVTSFNGRTGAITLGLVDITNAGGAPIASPAFSGLPNAPTAAPGTSTSQLATTAFVQAAVQASVGGVASFNTRTGAVTLTAGDITGAGGALLNSPGFTGTPTAPTAPNNTNTTQLATCAYVQNEIAQISAGVTSFNTRSGNVVLSLADVTAAGGAPQASPALSGIPTAPTAAPGTSTTQIATTAFVTAAVGAAVTSFNGRTGAITLTNNDVTAAGGLANPSPNLLGIPTASTATFGTNTTQLATTQFVQSAVQALTPTIVGPPPPPAAPNSGAGWFNTNEQQLYIWNGSAWVIAVNPPMPNLTGYAPLNSPTFTGTVTIPTGASIAGYLTTANAATTYAPLASPALTGTPTVPTASLGTSTTQAASTQFVQQAVAPALNDVGRNLIHNARFDVRQRGNGGWSSGYTADRWIAYPYGSDTQNTSMVAMTDTNRSQIGDESPQWMLYSHVVGSAVAGSTTQVMQRIERVQRLSNRTVIVSFWVAAGVANLVVGCQLAQVFGTGGSPSATVYTPVQRTTILGTGIFQQRYSLAFSLPSAAGKTFGTNGDDYTQLTFIYSDAANVNAPVQTGDFYLWGVQLEIAQPGQTQPTPLEKISYDDDLRHCMRFYQGGTPQIQIIASGYAAGAGIAQYASWLLPVQMRAQPTTNFIAGTTSNATALQVGSYGLTTVFFQWNSSAAGPTFIICTFTASADL